MTRPKSSTGRTTELLQSLIRNACVNDGTPDSGNEVRNADLLADYLEGAGLDVERFESHPGRTSIVARIEGPDPTAPSLCLMGHTDVVPVNPDGWSRDPFGGEVVAATRRQRRGVGTRRHRHAQHHVVDGRGVPPTRRRGLPAHAGR